MENKKKIFIQRYNDRRIDKIILYNNNSCEIQFNNGLVKALPFSCDSVYCAQYGIPLSTDGSIILFSNWEDGLTAYHIDKETILWRYKKSRITKVFICLGYVVAIRYGKSIVKLDLNTGEVCSIIQSSTIEKAFALTERYLLIDSIKGNVAIIDAMDFCIMKKYRKLVVNPNSCLSIVINNAFLSNNNVVIAGFEEYPERNINNNLKNVFERIIDPVFI